MSAYAHNLPIKKQYGQHFLRQQSIVDTITGAVCLDKSTNVFEIGCGDGILTRSIVQYPIERLWVFEIDKDWATYVRQTVVDERLTIFEQNFLDLDFSLLEPYKPWTLLANLPYQITFPILHLLQKNRHLLKEGVIMVQEEVAQKIFKKGGRGYGFISLYFNHFFSWKLLAQVPPGAFFPPPKVFSRLLYFKPIAHPPEIPFEEKFWKFIKICFHQPRRTLKNNLSQTDINLQSLPPEMLMLRAQQLNFEQLVNMWKLICNL